MVFLATVVPAALIITFTFTFGHLADAFVQSDVSQAHHIHKLPLCSSGVILHLSDDHRYRTRGYLAWNPITRAVDSCLVLLPIANNRTNSCLLLTKLLAGGFVAHSSLVQVYNLISDVLGQLFGLAHGGEVEGVKYDSLDRFILYMSPVEIRCTLLGLMRTNLCASWAHNWSVGARIVAVW